MAARQTSKRVDSRERARLARAALDVERARRDEAIESAAAGFFDAADARTELMEQLAAVDEVAAARVADLAGLGESPKRICALLSIDAAEVRRLRALNAAAADDAPRVNAAEGDTGGGDHDERPAVWGPGAESGDAA